MASLRTIRGRIKVVRNSQKITKAMKMVAAAKLRRAQDAVLRARPYAQLIDEMLASLARARADADLPPHPLMAARPIRRVEVVLMTSDRGLCGGFNSNTSRPEVLQALLPRYLAMQIWRALLESEASEHGARMTAMDSATKNASEMIGRLTLDYNRARQAAITKELMEIVSGAEALK